MAEHEQVGSKWLTKPFRSGEMVQQEWLLFGARA
jgi:hypothetical protein